MMSPEIASVVVGGLASWASIMAALLHRTNGSGPLSRKLDSVRTELKIDITELRDDVRDLKADHREHIHRYHVGDGR